MEYMTLLAQTANIAIMRVENGWIIRTNEGLASLDRFTPLKVAQNPDALAHLVREWAQGQVSRA